MTSALVPAWLPSVVLPRSVRWKKPFPPQVPYGRGVLSQHRNPNWDKGEDVKINKHSWKSPVMPQISYPPWCVSCMFFLFIRQHYTYIQHPESLKPAAIVWSSGAVALCRNIPAVRPILKTCTVEYECLLITCFLNECCVALIIIMYYLSFVLHYLSALLKGVKYVCHSRYLT